MAKFCSNCGSPLNPDDRFCANCGGIVEGAPAAEPEAAPAEPEAPAEEAAPAVEEPAIEEPAAEEPAAEPVIEEAPASEAEPEAPAVEPEPVKAAEVDASAPIETFEEPAPAAEPAPAQEPVPQPAPIPTPPPTPAPAQVYQPAPAPAYQPAPAPAQPVYQAAPAAAAAPAVQPGVSGMCVAGFITALLLLFPFNWIFSIVGIHACKKHGKRGKGLGIFGLVWSIITTLAFIAIVGCGIVALNNFSSDFDVDEFEDAMQEIIEEYD